MLGREDYMTRRAGNGALTRALQIDVVFMCNAEDVISFVCFHGFDKLAFGIFEVDFDPGRLNGVKSMRVERDTIQLTLYQELVYLCHHAIEL